MDQEVQPVLGHTLDREFSPQGGQTEVRAKCLFVHRCSFKVVGRSLEETKDLIQQHLSTGTSRGHLVSLEEKRSTQYGKRERPGEWG
jgi:hypothetical protein